MINIVTKHTNDARNSHINGVLKKTRNRIKSSSLPTYLKTYLDINISDILEGEPMKLLSINEDFYRTVRGSNKKRFDSVILEIFNYELFKTKKIEYNAYNLAENLNIYCCPNCNRQYSITVNSASPEGQLTRPDFDHYFPQNEFPLLVLSFYNLIPSCKICNSTFKGAIPMKLEDHLHPYLDNVINEFSFDYVPSSTEINKCEKITIKYIGTKNEARIKTTFDLFKIEETYNGHKFIVDQLLSLKKCLNDDYLKILTQNTYEGIDWTPEEAYRIGFGVNYKDDELYEHPFSKLKRDILSNEGMLSIFAKV